MRVASPMVSTSPVNIVLNSRVNALDMDSRSVPAVAWGAGKDCSTRQSTAHRAQYLVPKWNEPTDRQLNELNA